MARREEDLAPRLKIVHAERIGRAAEHLVSVVARAAETGFADAAFAHESLSEARRAYVLWQRCLAERNRDLRFTTARLGGHVGVV